MEQEINVVPADQPAAATRPTIEPAGESSSLGELFSQLAQDSSTLVKQEIALAKAELSESARTVGKAAGILAAGGAILLLGLLVLTAFFVILLGDALDNYWLGALIAGLLYVVIGAVLLLQGKNKLQHADLKPDRTIATLQEDKRWAQAEVQQVKRELTS